MVNGKCVLHDKWLKDPRYQDWLIGGKTKGHARCTICTVDFSISWGVGGALDSHARSNWHSPAI